jgi:hypothetical protein
MVGTVLVARELIFVCFSEYWPDPHAFPEGLRFLVTISLQLFPQEVLSRSIWDNKAQEIPRLQLTLRRRHKPYLGRISF